LGWYRQICKASCHRHVFNCDGSWWKSNDAENNVYKIKKRKNEEIFSNYYFAIFNFAQSSLEIST
jgi:hypothetical protein